MNLERARELARRARNLEATAADRRPQRLPVPTATPGRTSRSPSRDRRGARGRPRRATRRSRGALARGADGRARQLGRHLLPDRARLRRRARRARRRRRADARARVPLGERRRLPRGAQAGRGDDADRRPRDGRGGRAPRASRARSRPSCCDGVVARGEEALARTPEHARRCCARRASSTPAAPGCSRSSAASPPPSRASRSPEAGCRRRELGVDAIHQELSQYRYCTVFVVEGEGLDADALERELEPLGDSLLVVGDADGAQGARPHRRPGRRARARRRAAARSRASRSRTCTGRRSSARSGSRPALAGAADARDRASSPSSPGEGNRRLFESHGATRVIEGGQTMNPSTAEHRRRDRGRRRRPR